MLWLHYSTTPGTQRAKVWTDLQLYVWRNQTVIFLIESICYSHIAEDPFKAQACGPYLRWGGGRGRGGVGLPVVWSQWWLPEPPSPKETPSCWGSHRMLVPHFGPTAPLVARQLRIGLPITILYRFVANNHNGWNAKNLTACSDRGALGLYVSRSKLPCHVARLCWNCVSVLSFKSIYDLMIHCLKNKRQTFLLACPSYAADLEELFESWQVGSVGLRTSIIHIHETVQP